MPRWPAGGDFAFLDSLEAAALVDLITPGLWPDTPPADLPTPAQAAKIARALHILRPISGAEGRIVARLMLDRMRAADARADRPAA